MRGRWKQNSLAGAGAETRAVGKSAPRVTRRENIPGTGRADAKSFKSRTGLATEESLQQKRHDGGRGRKGDQTSQVVTGQLRKGHLKGHVLRMT